ncbi:MAG TPA: DUF4352 domain-containing protein [Ktedonobacteraceae bacterium]|nr:DUF4352 domain-containing protein [Ktedonobacteraceae bacterium]
MYQKRISTYSIIVLALFLLLTACTTSNTASNQGAPSGNPSSSTPQAQPTVIYGTSIPGTPGTGPIVILTPTTAPGGNPHSQLVTLADRTLIIANVSQQAGNDSNSKEINLTMTIKNTSTKPIMNEAAFFQLIGSEGDAFGVTSGTTSNFFATVAPQSSRSATIVFQVPVGTVNGLHLLYRPEVATETVSVALNFS